MVAPFLVPLKKWISQQTRTESARPHQESQALDHPLPTTIEVTPELVADDNLAASGASMTDTATPGDQQTFDRLVAHLRDSVPNQDRAAPSIPAPQLEEARDAAAELKRLLSVGTSPVAPLTSAADPVRSNGHPPVAASLAQGYAQPRTPFEQITVKPPQPQSPHPHHSHHNPRSLQLSHLISPPPFSLPTAQMQQRVLNVASQPGWMKESSIDASLHHASSAIQPTVPPARPFHMNGHPQSMLTSSAHHQLRQPMPIAGTSGPSQHPSHHGIIAPTVLPVPRPYRQTGDPLSSNAGLRQRGPTPVVPPASTLPRPKLTTHTLSLLNTLKSGDKQVKSGSNEIGRQPAPAQTETHDHSNSLPSAPHPIRNTAIAVGGPVCITPEPPLQPVPLVPTATSKAELLNSKATHQNALLSLFRSSNTPAATMQPILQGQLAPDLAELSAHASPGNPGMPASHQRINATVPAPVQTALAELATTHAPRKITSATVSGPLNDPAFHAVRAHRRPHDRGDTPKWAPTGLQESAVGTILVDYGQGLSLGRGTIQNQHATQPGRKALIPEKPEPLLPQALHQQYAEGKSNAPDTAPFGNMSAVAKRSASDRARSSMPRAIVPGLNSPVSPLPNRRSGEYTSTSETTPTKPDSVTSRPQGHRGHLAKGSGQGTPVTPVDKSFLLGFLEGVVKGAR